MTKNDLVARLIRVRRQAGLTQASLANRLGVTPASIALYETQKRRVPTEMAERWCAACGAELHLVITPIGEVPAASLHGEEAALIGAFRQLGDVDRQLIETLADALKDCDPWVREMLAVQVPVLRRSAHRRREAPHPDNEM